MDVDKILLEINTYTFTKEDILYFLMQESKKFSSLSIFKHMLLSLTENDLHLERLIASFYHLEYGVYEDGELSVRIQNKEVKKQKKEILNSRQVTIRNVLTEFTNGKCRSIQEILNYGKSIYDFLDLYYSKMKVSIDPLLEKAENVKQGMDKQDNQMLLFRKTKKEYQKSLQYNGPFVVEERKINKEGVEQIKTHTYTFFKKFMYRRHVGKLSKKMEHLKREKNKLKLEEKNLLDTLEECFENENALQIWNLLMRKFSYYNKAISLKELFFSLLEQGKYYEKVIDDFFSCSQVIREYIKLYSYIKNGNALVFVCKKIRECFIKNNSVYKQWDIDVRKVDVVKSTENPYRIYGYTELPKKMEELNKNFTSILEEKNKEEFLKKCATFYLDMIIVEPFLEGNNKTMRVLQTLMLTTHNIFVPSKYVLPFKNGAIKTLYQTYGEIEEELLKRYEYYYSGSK